MNKIVKMCHVDEAEFLAFSNQYCNLSHTFYYFSLLYYVMQNIILFKLLDVLPWIALLIVVSLMESFKIIDKTILKDNGFM